MSAAITDKFTGAFNSANPNVAKVTAGRTAGALSLSCDNLAGWPTATAVHFSTYKIDTTGAVVAGSQIDWKGLVAGNTVGTMTRKAGATDAGNAIGDIVEMNPTGSWEQDLIDGLLVHADQDGTLKAGAVDVAAVLASDVVTTAKILNGNVTNAKLAADISPVKFANPYKFRAYMAGNHTGSGTILFDTASFDTGSNFNTTTHAFVAPIDGFYFFVANLSFSGTTGGVGLNAILAVGGTGVMTGNQTVTPTSGTGNVALSVSGLLQLSATNTVTVQQNYTSATSVGTSTGCNFMGFLVSAT